tara:strand:- start:542 stop:1249 length:708 start_codon:yes stop_codon:yes gene_type:complete
MSILSNAVSGKITKPKKIMIYGEHATGKSTCASKFPKAIFLATEDGTNEIDCTRVNLTKAVDVLKAAAECAQSDYETVVLDSADWFEKLIDEALREENFKTDYGKGIVEVARRFCKVLSAFDKCIEAGKTVILLAHQEVRKAEDIAGNQWDVIRPKLSKKACERVMEWADIIVHAKHEVFVRQEEGDFGRTKGIATTTGRRILNSQPHPSYVAKSRVDLPATIDQKDFPKLILGE